jgi:hypothetical protein
MAVRLHRMTTVAKIADGTSSSRQPPASRREARQRGRDTQMIDRTTKLLLSAIVIGLWANVLTPILKINAAHASKYYNHDYFSFTTEPSEKSLTVIANTLADISNGTCTNIKIC